MATETLGDAAGKAAESGGMPQLDFSTFPNQIFWLVITLVAIYLILTRVSLPRIAATLGERQGTITNDLAKAEDLKAQAEQAEAAYNKALAEAKAEAQRIAAAARAEIQAIWTRPSPRLTRKSPPRRPSRKRPSPRSVRGPWTTCAPSRSKPRPRLPRPWVSLPTPRTSRPPWRPG